MHARLTFLRFEGFFLVELAPGELSASSAVLGSRLIAEEPLDADADADVDVDAAAVEEEDGALAAAAGLVLVLDGEADE